MPILCPKCSQATRIGAKYCGYCGTSIINTTQAESQPLSKSNAACPHCSSPLRPGIKYCANCGKLAAPAHAPAPAMLMPAVPVDPTVQRASRERRRRKRLVVSLGAAVLLCLALAIPAGLFGRPLIRQLLSPATPTHTPTQTAIRIPTNTPTALPSATPPASATPLPSATPTKPPTPTYTLRPSLTPTRLMPPTSTPTSIPVLLADEFNAPLDINWEIWGTPNLTPLNTNDLQALLIKASDINAGGISSLNNQIALTPGMYISFTANVDYLDDQLAVLRFAWSPGTATPADLTTAEELPLVLLIDSRQLTVQITGADGMRISCRYPVEDAAHTYRIDIGQNMLPAITVDGQQVCLDTLPALARPSLPVGRIHFSGRGLVDQIYISFNP